ncbi:MAG: hypothetical protein PHU46_11615 [Rhodocyclaceae bacterium]|nr:hypothetical protein [Rhodocyclaceae bacterium]
MKPVDGYPPVPPSPAPHERPANRNNRLLERLQAVYSAVMQLSEQGYTVESVDVNTERPKLVVLPENPVGPLAAGEVIGAKRACGCFVFWVAPPCGAEMKGEAA